MPYYVSKTDGSIITVLDGTKDTTSTSLTLFGRLVSNYGDETNENFVRLLENFAYTNSPAHPTTGQLWFDTNENIIKVYSTNNTWISVGSNIQGNLILNGNLLALGPNLTIKDDVGNVLITNTANVGNISFFSNVNGVSTRTLHINGGNGLVEVGANAVNNLGITTKIYVDALNDIVTTNLAQRTANINSINANIGAYQNFANSNLSTQTTNVASLNANLAAYQAFANTSIQSLTTSVNGVVSGSGSVNSKEILLNSNVAMNNSGVGNVAVNFQTPGGITFLSAQGSNSANTPVTILGQWNLGFEANLEATYADLAEYYEGDREYEPGTVVVFGGNKEVTITNIENDTRVVGIVTTNPAYIMNSQQQGLKVCVALVGRVPCKVIGPVSKGDLLTTSEISGYAKRVTQPKIGAVLGKAIEDKIDHEAGMIQVAVGKS